MLIDEVKAALEGATPGRWNAAKAETWWVYSDYGEVAEVMPWAGGNDEGDARLMAFAPDMARALIAAEELAAALEWTLADIAGYTKNTPCDHRANAVAEAFASLAAYRKATEGRG